jgi:diacylglycerol kinase family enzyme
MSIGSPAAGCRAPVAQTRPWARLFVNPASGGRHATDQLPTIVAALESSGLQVVASFTQAAQDPADEVAQAVGAGCRLVIAAGGDGIVSAIAKGLWHT